MPRPSRDQLLQHPDALDCTLYRAARDPNAEEDDLGDGRILLLGSVEPIAPEDDEQELFSAWVEPLAEASARAHFSVREDDFLAVTEADGRVQMYYVQTAEPGEPCVLVREDDELE